MAACALAETIGMTSAATAARVGDSVGSRWAALGVVVAGGLVEGTALGLAQSSVLAARLPGLGRRAYAVATVVVAGLGWRPRPLPRSSPWTTEVPSRRSRWCCSALPGSAW